MHPRRPPLTDDEFAAFCQQYPDCMVEVTAGGEIVIMPPTYSKTSIKNGWILAQLVVWSRADRRGHVLDSKGGVVLPSGARRSPDASWVRKDRIAALPFQQRSKYFHLCPDFVIEIRSSNDRLRKLQAKMREYMANGAELGWLIDPGARKVWVYRPAREPEVLNQPERVHGAGPIAGFVLELAEIWE